MSLFVRVIYGLYLLFKLSRSVCTNTNLLTYNPQPNELYIPASFISRTKWSAKAWPSNECPIPLTKIEFITIHHTSGEQANNIETGMKIIQNIQQHQIKTKKWSDIGTHILIDSAGNTYQGCPFYDDNEIPTMKPIAKDPKTYSWPRPRFIQGAHVKNHNKNNLGVNVMGCYTTSKDGCSTPNNIVQYDKTYVNLVQLLSYLCKYLGLNCGPKSNTLRTHDSFVETICPGKIGAMLETIKHDIIMSISGNGLCIDYNKHNLGGQCISTIDKCESGVIINAAHNQCQSAQKCCKMSKGDHERMENVVRKKTVPAPTTSTTTLVPTTSTSTPAPTTTTTKLKQKVKVSVQKKKIKSNQEDTKKHNVKKGKSKVNRLSKVKKSKLNPMNWRLKSKKTKEIKENAKKHNAKKHNRWNKLKNSKLNPVNWRIKSKKAKEKSKQSSNKNSSKKKKSKRRWKLFGAHSINENKMEENEYEYTMSRPLVEDNFAMFVGLLFIIVFILCCCIGLFVIGGGFGYFMAIILNNIKIQQM